MWKRSARATSFSPERFLEVTTWYLDGSYVPYNDQSRPALLGDDFTTWADDLRRVWYDLQDASIEVDFAMVSPIPPTSPLASIHILLYQQITTGHIGTVVTVYDNAVLLCPEGVDRAQLLEITGKTITCQIPGVSCRTWYDGREIFHVSHAYPHRASLVSWDDSPASDEAAALLQTHVSTTFTSILPMLRTLMMLQLQCTIATSSAFGPVREIVPKHMYRHGFWT